MITEQLVVLSISTSDALGSDWSARVSVGHSPSGPGVGAMPGLGVYSFTLKDEAQLAAYPKGAPVTLTVAPSA